MLRTDALAFGAPMRQAGAAAQQSALLRARNCTSHKAPALRLSYWLTQHSKASLNLMALDVVVITTSFLEAIAWSWDKGVVCVCACVWCDSFRGGRARRRRGQARLAHSLRRPCGAETDEVWVVTRHQTFRGWFRGQARSASSLRRPCGAETDKVTIAALRG